MFVLCDFRDVQRLIHRIKTNRVDVVYLWTRFNSHSVRNAVRNACGVHDVQYKEVENLKMLTTASSPSEAEQPETSSVHNLGDMGHGDMGHGDMGRVDPLKARELMDRAAAEGRVLSPKLQSCQTVQDYIRYAQRRGASVWPCNGTHTRISHNGANVTVSSSQNASPKQLQNSARKKTVEAFVLMGIAWDN